MPANQLRQDPLKRQRQRFEVFAAWFDTKLAIRVIPALNQEIFVVLVSLQACSPMLRLSDLPSGRSEFHVNGVTLASASGMLPNSSLTLVFVSFI